MINNNETIVTLNHLFNAFLEKVDNCKKAVQIAYNEDMKDCVNNYLSKMEAYLDCTKVVNEELKNAIARKESNNE